MLIFLAYTTFPSLKQNNQGTRENFETILKLGKSATINILNEMLEKEIIEKKMKRV